jgi:hypothetical protein
MVMMALVTTFMTGPALNLIDRLMPEKQAIDDFQTSIESEKYSILFSFGNTLRGRKMLRLGSAFIKSSTQTSSITALHITSTNELNTFNLRDFERNNFAPIQAEAEKLKIGFNKMFQAAVDIEREIINVANSANYNLVIIGIGQSIFRGTILGKLLGITKKYFNPFKIFFKLVSKQKLYNINSLDDQSRNILSQVKAPVGIFIDKNYEKSERIIVPIFDAADAFLVFYISKLYENSRSKITILDSTRIFKSDNDHAAGFSLFDLSKFRNLEIIHTSKPDKKLLENSDLMLISLTSWENVVNKGEAWLSSTPSVLVIRQ